MFGVPETVPAAVAGTSTKENRNTVTRTNSKTRTIPTAAELSRIALAEARVKLATWQELHEQAEAAAEELRSRLDGGDDTPTAAELGSSADEVERTGRLLGAAERKVKRAERSLINDDTALAEVFADVLSEAFGGLVPVRIVTTRSEVKPSDAGEPVLYLTQDKPGQNTGGILSGELALTFYRSSLLAPLDPRRVEELCRARGYSVEAIPRSGGRIGDQYEDGALFRVHTAGPAVPVLAAAPDDSAVRYFAQGVTGALGQAVKVNTGRMVYLNAAPTERMLSELVSHRVLATDTAADGDVTLTVEVASRVLPSTTLATGYAHERLRAAITDRVGAVEPNLGRVVEAEPVTVETPDPKPHATGQAWTVRARYVITHRVA